MWRDKVEPIGNEVDCRIWVRTGRRRCVMQEYSDEVTECCIGKENSSLSTGEERKKRGKDRRN